MVKTRWMNWEECLWHFFTVQVPAFGEPATLYNLLEMVSRGELKPVDVKHRLAKVGLGLVLPGEFLSPAAGYIVAVPNSSELVMLLFENTRWSASPLNDDGLWKDALRQAPADIVMADKRFNRKCINGKCYRCTLVIFKAAATFLRPTFSDNATDIPRYG